MPARFFYNQLIFIFAVADRLCGITRGTAFFFTWEKLLNREINTLESFARVGSIAVTFSVRNAIIICRDKNLCVTLHLNNLKQTEGYKYCFRCTAGRNCILHRIKNRLRERRAYRNVAITAIANIG